MPYFYLHLKDGNRLLKDEDGVELPSVEHAREMALQAARELCGEAIKAGMDLVGEAFVIADECGRVTFVPFSDALPKRLRRTI
jgi:hypothetical protein